MFNRLYIHVPFCVKKCSYCAFVSRHPRQDELAEYPDLLLRELQLCPTPPEPLTSIYFGGGTPSLLRPQQIDRLLDRIAGQIGITADAEITLEANPGTVTLQSLREFRNAGINRLSLGIQSFNDHVLASLGRIHSSTESYQAYRDARSAGFTSVSIDLIHSLPGQTLDQWSTELSCAVELQPEHLSIYGLTIEQDTPFALIYPPGTDQLPDEDLSADMFERADELLPLSGFEHYEIANYARPGFRSRHNSGYWKRDGYRGLGVAAHSFLRDGYGVRFSNTDNLSDYRQQLLAVALSRNGESRLTRNGAMAEYMFLGLRLAEGVCRTAFLAEFNQSVESAYPDVLVDLVRLQLISDSGDALTLTRRGMLLSNRVFASFL